MCNNHSDLFYYNPYLINKSYNYKEDFYDNKLPLTTIGTAVSHKKTQKLKLTLIFFFKNMFFRSLINYDEANRGAAAGGVTANRLVVGSIPTRGDEIFT